MWVEQRKCGVVPLPPDPVPSLPTFFSCSNKLFLLPFPLYAFRDHRRPRTLQRKKEEEDLHVGFFVAQVRGKTSIHKNKSGVRIFPFGKGRPPSPLFLSSIDQSITFDKCLGLLPATSPPLSPRRTKRRGRRNSTIFHGNGQYRIDTRLLLCMCSST